jgi:hypothetical protein
LGLPAEKSKAVLFFSSFSLGIMIEDGIQEAWRRLSGADKAGVKESSADVPLWHKAVGFIWVATWLLITSPWFLYPTTRLPTDVKWIVPFSVVEKLGMPTTGAILLVGGLFLKFAAGGEI